MHDLLATDAQGYCVTAAGHVWVGGQLESKACTSVPCGTCALFSFKPDTPRLQILHLDSGARVTSCICAFVATLPFASPAGSN